MTKQDIILGIDLGTSNSGVAIIDKDGYPVMLENQEGRKTIPSIVSYRNGEFIVGDLAKRQMVVNPDTVLSVKRSMGTDTKFKLGNKYYSPEEISAKILRNIKEYAEAKIGHPVTRAVITVPAYFNDAERRATKIAAKLAGLTVEKIINEPTAAALAYGIRNTRKQKVLVVDFGGGTLDVSVLRIGDGTFEVIATSGDNRLGGDDLDQAIIDWIADEELELIGMDLRNDVLSLQRLKEAAEKAKIELSFSQNTSITLPFIATSPSGAPINIEKELSRDKFYELIKPILDRVPVIIDDAMKASGFSYLDMNEVLLVGGTTRVPAVQKLIEKVTGIQLNHTVNPYEAVALGAAVQGGVITGEIQNISLLLDVTPLTLSLETADGFAEPIIPRNTKIPTFVKEIFTTFEDNQEKVLINVLQGERPRAKDNKSLGTFELNNIEKLPKGIPQIEVEFTIDIDGILSVKAKDLANGKSKSIEITDSTDTLTEDEIYRILEEARENKPNDNEFKKVIYLKEKMSSLPEALAKVYSIESEEVVSTEHKELLAKKFEKAQKALAKEDYENLEDIVEFLLVDISRLFAEIGYYERRVEDSEKEAEQAAKEAYWDNLFKEPEPLTEEELEAQKAKEAEEQLKNEIDLLREKLNQLESRKTAVKVEKVAQPTAARVVVEQPKKEVKKPAAKKEEK